MHQLFTKFIPLFVFLYVLCGSAPDAFSYICNKDASDGVSILVEKIEKITQFDTPQSVKIVLENKNDTPVSVSLTVNSIETVSVKGETQFKLDVPAEGKTEKSFDILAAPETYSAHYPVHVRASIESGTKKIALHAVQVVETDFGSRGITAQTVGKNSQGRDIKAGEIIDDPNELPLITLIDGTGLFLPNSKAYRVVWHQDKAKDKENILPIGFSGGDENSGVTQVVYDINRGGISRESFSVHPPWRGGPGTMFTEYRLKLPNSKKITFSFFGALRDLHPGEPPSDGITFRVRVDGEIVGGKHILSRTWVPVEVDLTKYAGKEILFALETDPGPARDTTCDSGMWGDPLIFCGEKPKTLTPEEKKALFAENLKILQTGKNVPNSKSMFVNTGHELRSCFTFGNYGLLDGVIGFGNDKMQVQYDGLHVWVEGQRLGSESSAMYCGPWEHGSEYMINTLGELFSQEIRIGERKLKMRYNLLLITPNPKISVNCSEDKAITKIEFGPATHHANRVYFGHGYCVEEPQAFQISGDGHTFSTSHIGFDFENGLSLLMASTFPPDYIAVNPETKRYTLGVHPGTTFTFVPGTKGAMDCAIRYRPFSDKKAAPGVKKKAGRFAFDWWGGKFTEQTKRIQEAVDYGVTDALVVVHNWQRWGYDNRLPDIWPPNPERGTIAEANETLDLCNKHGILYGLHDNYIDIYPDADDFSYDVVSFLKSGVPRKAWLNHGIDAQSYQFRPDKIMPFLDRNFEMMKPHLKQTTYFVDVFSSIYINDFWDRDGNLHSRRETRDAWCQAFDRIREHLGNDNPTISEAGDDFLIGHLDGSDCQFLTLSEFPGDFRIVLKCKKWSRVPWYDAVNHTRFSLHGVGYDSRYAANRGYDLHGYLSDDYMSTEILTAHPGQVGWGTPLRDTVRKYWLTQPLIRALADKEITSVEFVDGNIQRLLIQWSDGTRIFVNHGVEDWQPRNANSPFSTLLAHASIPQYGFMVKGTADSGIVKINSQIIEYYFSEGYHYINPRRTVAKNYLPTIPIAENFKYLGDNRFEIDVLWKLFRSIKERGDTKDYSWFLHLEEPKRVWYHRPEIVHVSGGRSQIPVREWEKDQRIATGEIALSNEIEAGTYNVLVGLWDDLGKRQRAPVLGLTPDNSRVKLGRLIVQKKNDKITDLVFEPEKEDVPELFERLLPNERPVQVDIDYRDFTYHIPFNGAYRMVEKALNHLEITPLPNEPPFEFVMETTKPRSVHAVDRKGKTIREVPFVAELSGDLSDKYSEMYILKFTTKENEFKYDIKTE